MPRDPMLTPEEARAIVLDYAQVLGPERVSLLDATGRVLAQDVLARRDNPPCDNSAMDGYAVRHADVAAARDDAPVALEVIEDIPAGKVPQKAVGPGQASRIMTGAAVPAGADTIAPVEDTRPAEQEVEILAIEECGAHIRRRGEDMRGGEPIIKAGTECGPGELAVLAAVQQSFVSVYRRPRVAILSTGDELVEIEETPGEGQIVNSNTCALAAFCHAHGAEPVMLPTVADDEAAIRATIEAALRADFAVSSGGVSVGEYDFVKKVLDDLGAETIFWRVAMKPGKPLVFLHGRRRALFRPTRQSGVEHDVLSPVRAPGHPQGRRLSASGVVFARGARPGGKPLRQRRRPPSVHARHFALPRWPVLGASRPQPRLAHH